MKLTEHFTLEELYESQTATRKGIDNTPPAALHGNLLRVADALEQIRALVGGPLTVSSGYRCKALNEAIGSGATSAHVQGLAADISATSLSARALAILIRESGIELDQLIYEGTWVHIGLSAGAPRRQVLTANFAGGKATYSTGIS